ncbi:sugar phosphate isomerase/epimerase [bacterium]|nr:sugar phosphate isomerase/epimerase [bacterium]
MDQLKGFPFSIVLSCQATRFEAATFQGDFKNNLTRVVKLGYTGVELAIRSPREMDYPALYYLVNTFSLKVPAIGTGQAWGEEHLSFTDPDASIREQAIQRVKDHIPSAAYLKAHIIIGLLRGKIQPGITREQAEAWLVIALQQCAKAAKGEGVSLCLEPINRYETNLINTVESGLELIEKVGANNFGLLLDSFHMNIEESDICAAIRKAGNRIFHFHAADSNRWYPGAGHINFDEILQTLQSIGYNGFISGEFLPVPDALTGAERGIQFLNTIQKKLNKSKAT